MKKVLNEMEVYDLMLAGIPTSFFSTIIIGSASPVPFVMSVAFAGLIGSAIVFFALFVFPPTGTKQPKASETKKNKNSEQFRTLSD